MTDNNHVNPYEIGKAGKRAGNPPFPPLDKAIRDAPVDADKHYSVVPSTGVYDRQWPNYMMAEQDGLPPTLGPSLPQGFQGKISSAGWTKNAEGFAQQTFLGASITNFNINTGFGNSSSSLSVTLVNDEHNRSDGTWYGSGDDVYHRGGFGDLAYGDQFIPPTVGTPVFFKFGRHHATVAQAWLKTYYQKYGNGRVDPRRKNYYTTNTFNRRGEGAYLDFSKSKNLQYLNIKHDTGNDPVFFWEDDNVQNIANLDPNQFYNGKGVTQPIPGTDPDLIGWDHFVFGGILSSVSQSVGSSKTYSVNVTDPREILSNVTLVLNDYQGTTFNNKNLYNVCGFLEYDFSKKFMDQVKPHIISSNPLVRGPNGTFTGNDTYTLPKLSLTNLMPPPVDQPVDPLQGVLLYGPEVYPMTGQGFSRRSEIGMPVYRINQALVTMFHYYGRMWQEHIDGGFGGPVDFRGYNYVVDLTGIPFEKIPPLYNIEASQIDLLSYIQELCETINHDYFVSLLPVLDLPPTKFLYQYNQNMMQLGRFGDIITGIIRIDTIDKSVVPEPGSVEKYINILTDRYRNENYPVDTRKIDNPEDRKYIESKNIGYDLSNEVTDRFVVGAQEVNMYAFSRCKDGLYRKYLKKQNEDDEDDGYEKLRDVDMWDISTMLKQQVVPFYGFLGKNAVTIPIGFGPFQQIMLDSSKVAAKNVGDYYVTTEMELRAASISFNAWYQFLKYYNERYIELFNTYIPIIGEDIGNGQVRYTPQYVDKIHDADKIAGNFIREIFEKKGNIGTTPNRHWSSFKTKSVDAESPNEYDYYEGIEACSVPRCAFSSATPAVNNYGLALDPCSPPYGYPLYYKRAERLGLGGGGYVEILQEVKDVQSSQENMYKQMLEEDPELKYLLQTGDANGITMQTFEKKDDQGRIIIEPAMINSFYETLNKEVKKINERYGIKNGDPTSLNEEKLEKYKKDLEVAQKLIEKLEILQSRESEFGANHYNDLVNQLFSSRYKNFLTLRDRGASNAEVAKAATKAIELNMKNAQKVYEWLKGVADKHLGKTYLVKMPRYTNVNYKHRIGPLDLSAGTYTWVDSGPFGFPPRYNDARKNVPNGAFPPASLYDPKNKNTTSDYLNKEDFHHFLQNDDNIDERLQYREGALRSNWNQMDGLWEHNYKPEPQGGFFDWTMYASGISNKNRIVPNAVEFLTQGYRVKPYVRFDHSQYYDLTNINSANNVTEEIPLSVRVESFISDLYTGFSAQSVIQRPEQQADKILDKEKDNFTYVEVSVDEKLYMPPKITGVKTHRFAETYTWVAASLIWRDVKTTEKKDGKDVTVTKEGYNYPPIQWRPGNDFFWKRDEDGYWVYDTNAEKSSIEQKGVYYTRIPGSSQDIEEFIEKVEASGYGGASAENVSVDVGVIPVGQWFGDLSHPKFPYGRLYDGTVDNQQDYKTDIDLEAEQWIKVTTKRFSDFKSDFIRNALAGVEVDFSSVSGTASGEYLGPLNTFGYPYCKIEEDFFESQSLYINNMRQDVLISSDGETINYDSEKSYNNLDSFVINYRFIYPTFSVTLSEKQIEGEKHAYARGWFAQMDRELEQLQNSINAADACPIPSGDGQIKYTSKGETVQDFVRYGQKNPTDFQTSDQPMRIITDDIKLDDQHVYALVTLPGRVNAKVDGFMSDGLKSDNRAAVYAKMCSSDVTIKFDYDIDYELKYNEPVTNEDGEEESGGEESGGEGSLENSEAENTTTNLHQNSIQERDVTIGVSMSPRLKMKNLLGEGSEERYLKNFNAFLNNKQNVVKLSSPETDAHFTSPTPIIPHLFVLPIMSNERCYGPWLSAGSGAGFVGISDIGGKVEFSKDENLAPWTYGGYSEMNRVGLMKAQFSNSLQLYSEKGSFTLADAPTGISIAEPLVDGGPLITSISVSVSEGGIKTTLNMDSYTNNFGRLTKQKEDQLAKLTRDRQKNIDQLNDLRKKGVLRKQAQDVNLNPEIGLEKTSSDDGKYQFYKEKGLEAGNTVYSNIVWSAEERKKDIETTDENGNPKTQKVKDTTAFTSMQHEGYLQQAQEQIEDYIELNLARQKTAGNALNALFVGYDKSVHNPFMPHKEYNPTAAKTKRMRL